MGFEGGEASGGQRTTFKRMDGPHPSDTPWKGRTFHVFKNVGGHHEVKKIETLVFGKRCARSLNSKASFLC